MSMRPLSMTSYETTQNNFFKAGREEEWRKQNLYKKISPDASDISMTKLCCGALKTGEGKVILGTTVTGGIIGTCIEPGGGTIVGGAVGAAVGITLVVAHKIRKKKKASLEEKEIRRPLLEKDSDYIIGKNDSKYRTFS